jgi:Helicase HerA, central domain
MKERAMTSSILGQDVTSQNLIRLSQKARLQGLYIVGVTGTGKSTLIENIAVQDIQQGLGICLLDPHGDTTLSIISRLPYYREQDVIFLDIKDKEFPFGLNLFESYDPTNALEVQQTLSQVMHIFHKLFDITPSTPRLYEFMYNCS